MKTLFEELTEYSESNILPCHMPGHKRKSFGDLPEDFVKIDLTEVEGTDNLHEPSGILKDAEDRAALLCHARESFFLVGGSTAGILAAISAAVPAGGTLLLPRCCHRSVYHAMYLRRTTPVYLEAETASCGIPEPPAPEEVAEKLFAHPEAAAVLITSPTYEGRFAEVRRIAEAVHAAGKTLIVDEAHGAHLGWSDALPESAAQAGADLVIQSTHKTLPAPTQTALLHQCSDRVSEERIRRFLRIYETSSPSYPLM
ncbi:MAG: ornithine decarboxylase, partial [Lachnospiraceae bacterium]|nr:ornithine decarboxylase [Lachnospiraceae bacterium]